MIPGTMGERPADVLIAVERQLNTPSTTASVTAGELLGLLNEAQLETMIRHALGEKPSALDTIKIAMSGLTGGSSSKRGVEGMFDILPSAGTVGMVFGHLKNEVDRHKYNVRSKAVRAYLKSFSVSRAMVSLDNREKSILRGMAAMLSDGGLSILDWQQFYALLVWADGKGQLQVPPGVSSSEHASGAERLLRAIVAHALPSHAQNLADAASRLSGYTAKAAPLARQIADTVSQGARWLDIGDVAGSHIYALKPERAALVVGYLGDREDPVYFNGNESLITIGGPGAGKTQAQVIPNLLRYPGSAFVLDVKDELFSATAHARRRFGPVYWFAPTDPSSGSHRYNPFDVISSEPDQAAVDCQVLANELVPETGGDRDPYWDRKARQYVWAFAVMVALDSPPEERNLARVFRYLSIPTHFEEKGARYQRSETKLVVDRMRAIAEVGKLEGLASAAGALENGVTSNRLESVFDGARSRLSEIIQSPYAVAATSASDWSPAQLRAVPGSTVYLCLKPGQLKAFAPLVRLVFSQHVKQMLADFTRRPGEPPVTFFLDEMPQLGAMPGLTDIIDVGRGAGLRLWMFAQYLGQIRAIYGDKADGLIGACALRCFMQPDLDAARFISPQLGTTRHMFTGEMRPLAEPHDLMGRAFGQKIIALGRAEIPAQLTKRYAFEFARSNPHIGAA